MFCTSDKIRYLRGRIPGFECVPGCHDCCGPVTASSEEMARLPERARPSTTRRWPSSIVCTSGRKAARRTTSVR